MLIIRQSAEISKLRQKIADFLHKCLFRLPNLHCSRFQATSNRVIPHSVGKCRGATKKAPSNRVIPHSVRKCRGATKGTLSRQELATNEVSRLRDCSGSLVKGAVIEDDWGIKQRSTFFLKSIFWENPSGLPYGNPPPFTREAMAKMTEGLNNHAQSI